MHIWQVVYKLLGQGLWRSCNLFFIQVQTKNMIMKPFIVIFVHLQIMYKCLCSFSDLRIESGFDGVGPSPIFLHLEIQTIIYKQRYCNFPSLTNYLQAFMSSFSELKTMREGQLPRLKFTDSVVHYLLIQMFQKLYVSKVYFPHNISFESNAFLLCAYFVVQVSTYSRA